ncbi:MAG: hypothetical protein IPH31_02290 [Lewinellaceae bacterium]|nr:hypothetical protein [Lewinellaceae bacterium]
MSFKITLLIPDTRPRCRLRQKRERPSNNFDRGAMLRNYADNLIAPAFGASSPNWAACKRPQRLNIVLSTDALEVLQDAG